MVEGSWTGAEGGGGGGSAGGMKSSGGYDDEAPYRTASGANKLPVATG